MPEHASEMLLKNPLVHSVSSLETAPDLKDAQTEFAELRCCDPRDVYPIKLHCLLF